MVSCFGDNGVVESSFVAECISDFFNVEYLKFSAGAYAGKEAHVAQGVGEAA